MRYICNSARQTQCIALYWVQEMFCVHSLILIHGKIPLPDLWPWLTLSLSTIYLSTSILILRLRYSESSQFHKDFDFRGGIMSFSFFFQTQFIPKPSYPLANLKGIKHRCHEIRLLPLDLQLFFLRADHQLPCDCTMEVIILSISYKVPWCLTVGHQVTVPVQVSDGAVPDFRDQFLNWDNLT